MYLPIFGYIYSDDQQSPFFPFSWDGQKLIVDSNLMEKFVSQVVICSAATRVSLPTTKGGAEERKPGNADRKMASNGEVNFTKANRKSFT